MIMKKQHMKNIIILIYTIFKHPYMIAVISCHSYYLSLLIYKPLGKNRIYIAVLK